MSMEQVIDLSIQWGPTILFALIVLAGFLTGIRRGFRKSLLLALNALIAFVLVFLAYIWLVTNPNVDEYVVKYSNEVLAMLGQSNIQTLLGASDSANSLKEILTEIIPQKMSLGEGIAAVIEENGAYLGALVNSAYRLVFAVILGIVYLVLVFIFFIFYLIFFSERRYKKKKEKKYINCVGAGYKKRRLLGGLVGSLRSVVSGLVFLSFFGTLLFITTGGDGSNESVDVNFGDEKIDEYYETFYDFTYSKN